MNISISNAGGKSLYEQIYLQIRDMIMDGVLKEGEALPTIRSLAQDLRISVITTQRAYSELEKDGFICTVVGKGSFVAAKNKDLLFEENLKKIQDKITEAAQLARYCGLGGEEFEKTVKEVLRDYYDEKQY